MVTELCIDAQLPSPFLSCGYCSLVWILCHYTFAFNSQRMYKQMMYACPLPGWNLNQWPDAVYERRDYVDGEIICGDMRSLTLKLTKL